MVRRKSGVSRRPATGGSARPSGAERDTPPAPLAAFVAGLRAEPRLGRELVHALHLPAMGPRFAAPDPPLPAVLATALSGAGADPLWHHQAEAIAASRRGEDVLVTTPTASGKSLVFQVPVLEAALGGRPGRGLWLFPLKALGQDQKAKLDRLGLAAGIGTAGRDGGGALAAIYDGDTPRAQREAIRRDPPRVLITNPDMLHLGILPHWTSWGPFLVDLEWIVLDELHTYRGIFGSHFHHVLERLLRIARELGARPTFIASSATAANAPEFAATLTGRTFRAVADSGAPREGRHLLLFRPVASPYTTALDLFARLLRAGLKTIVFTKARRITELLGSWLARREPELARRVAIYRSGFLAAERRRIEASLFAGRLDGVVSTSALEMGIDVGGLDACVLVGYPGSVMATWQRSGRVGRAGRESLTALVALPDALDQWFLDHPDEMVGRPCEQLIVDPANPPVSRGHLLCAAAETPLRRPEDSAYLDRHAGEVEALLAADRLLEAVDGGGLFAAAGRPHRDVHLRGSGATWAIVAVDPESGRERTVGTLDGVRVHHEGHPGAIYLHAGRQYLVADLDPLRHRVLVAASEVDHYTTPLAEKETTVLEVTAERRVGPLQSWLGRVRVSERVVGYERKSLDGRETLSRHALDLPPLVFETVALWWAAPPAVTATLQAEGLDVMGALHAAEHATISLFPRLALCDRGDIGGISIPLHPQIGCGAVFVYDGHPGGVGIAAAGFAKLEGLLADVAGLVASCPCEGGCPSCIQSPKCGNGNRPLDKAGSVRLLDLLLGRSEPDAGRSEPVEMRLEVGEAMAAGAAAGGAPERCGVTAACGDAERPADGRAADGWATTGCGASALRGGLPSAARFPVGPVGGEGGGAEGSSWPRLRALMRSPVGWLRRRAATARGDGRSMGTLLFDLETLRSAAEVGGWGNAHRMGLAVAVVCHLEEGRFETYGEERVGELVAALAAARLVVGFNVRRFDYRVLSGYTGVDHGRQLPTLDLLDDLFGRLGFRIGLGHLAEATLGVGKSADGLQSLAWVREGRLDLVEGYCRRDVEVMRDLYLHGRREGWICYDDRRRGARLRVRVGW